MSKPLRGPKLRTQLRTWPCCFCWDRATSSRSSEVDDSKT